MKINREARNAAKKLFLLCRPAGRLDETRVRDVVKSLATARPRNYIAILSRLRKLVALEVQRHSAVVETASPLGAAEAELRSSLQKQFGPALNLQVAVNPELLGGLRVRVGSDVWDGSIRGRLHALEKSFQA